MITGMVDPAEILPKFDKADCRRQRAGLAI